MSVLKSVLVAIVVSVAALLTLAPAVSAQDYGPEAPEVTVAPEVTEAPPATEAPEVEGAPAPNPTTDVSVKSNANTDPEVAGPEVGANQLPITGSTVFPMVASGIGLVALGLVFRTANKIGSDEEQ